MIVKAHAKTAPNQFADHRPSPDPGHEARRLRSRVDSSRQLVELVWCQPGRSPRRLLGFQTVDSFGFVPLQPAIDTSSGDVQLSAQLDYRNAADVPQHGFGATPRLQIVAPFRALLQHAQFSQFQRPPSSSRDRMSLLRTWHNRLRRRDRRKMIFGSSSVNFLDPLQVDPV